MSKKTSTQQIKYRYSRKIKAFAANLKKVRKEKGMTQEEVADAAGVSYSTYNYAESGSTNISIALLFALADALDIDAKELLDF